MPLTGIILILKLRVGPHVVQRRGRAYNLVAVQAGKLPQRVKRHAVRGTNDAIGFGVKRGVPLVPVHQMPQPDPVIHVFHLIHFCNAAFVRVAAANTSASAATNAFGVIVFIWIRGIDGIDDSIRGIIRGTCHFGNGNRLLHIEGAVVPNAVAGLKDAGKGHNRRKVIQITIQIQINKTMRFMCNYVRFLHSLGAFKK